jgi:hypothetical protein
VKTASGSIRVTESAGSRRFSVRAQVAPAKPPPRTTIRPVAWARATKGAQVVPKDAAAVARKRRRADRKTS